MCCTAQTSAWKQQPASCCDTLNWETLFISQLGARWLDENTAASPWTDDSSLGLSPPPDPHTHTHTRLEYFKSPAIPFRLFTFCNRGFGMPEKVQICKQKKLQLQNNGRSGVSVVCGHLFSRFALVFLCFGQTDCTASLVCVCVLSVWDPKIQSGLPHWS